MDLSSYPQDYQINILDIGCGLGLDCLLVANAAIDANRSVRIVGFDFNSQMIDYATNLVNSKKD